ncbi:TetR/AcrR family transcriptional regulator [Acinetobacter pittii]|uniref:TetR/AcrR family transcriptional regulator n=1 Tax=Acinetobacter pittii TaxID=48296 RepID=UPI002AFDCB27|nr:TetR/AcrR family transcriptional regulator [Acinetobacter pittii]
MHKLLPGGKAKKLIDTSISLFTDNGFHNIGVDTIIRESKVSKTTLYKYFESKEKMIEVSLHVNKELLKEQVELIVNQTTYLKVTEKLKKIYYLHADLDSPYHLLLRAILEIKGTYPIAFELVVRYRTWLVNTVHELITQSRPSADFQDAYMFLFIVDGALTQLLSSKQVDDRERLFDYLMNKVCTK